MELGSHYYAVLALCRFLGLKKDMAYKIAYSSQMVDDALIERLIFKKKAKAVRFHIFNKQIGLDHCATCPKIMTIWSYNHAKMMRTLVPFHFVPSCLGNTYSRRIRTSLDSPILKKLIDSALESKDPYHLGIILHVLGDAHAHQGFSGVVSRGNRIRKLRLDLDTISGKGDCFLAKLIARYPKLHSRTLARILPMYSHSRVGTLPDLPSAEWSYEYDIASKNPLPKFKATGPISNPKRYIQAFQEFIELIQKFIDLRPELERDKIYDLQEVGFFDQLVKNIPRDEIGASWSEYLVKYGLFEKHDSRLIYDKHAWLRSAFKNYKTRMNAKTIPAKVIPVSNFARSHWYQFYLAQREYKKTYDRLIAKCDLKRKTPSHRIKI